MARELVDDAAPGCGRRTRLLVQRQALAIAEAPDLAPEAAILDPAEAAVRKAEVAFDAVSLCHDDGCFRSCSRACPGSSELSTGYAHPLT